MANFFSTPSFYTDNIYLIYSNCDAKTRKALFCLNKEWNQIQQNEKNYLELEKYQIMANKRIQAIGAYLSTLFVFENTDVPYDFKFCMTIDNIKKNLEEFYVNLNSKEAGADNLKILVLKSLSVFPRVIYSRTVAHNRFGEVPLALISAFKRCLDHVGDIKQQTKSLQKLAADFRESKNESYLLILADLAHKEGLDGVVVEEYVKYLVLEERFQDAWAVVDKLSNEELQAQLYTFIVDAQTKEEIVEFTIIDRSDKANPIFERKDKWLSSTKKDYAEAEKIYTELPDEYKKRFLQEATKAFFLCGEGELANKWVSHLLPQEKDNVLVLVYRECVAQGLNQKLIQALGQFGDHLLFLKLIKVVLNTSLNESLREELDNSVLKVCQFLIGAEDFQEAFECSGYIKNETRQSHLRVDICRGLKSRHQLDLMQKVLDSIKSVEIKQSASEDLSRETQQPLINQIQPITDVEPEPVVTIYEPFFAKAIENEILDPKAEWYKDYHHAKQIDESSVRDMELAKLAYEAKQLGWSRELDFVVGQIEDPMIITQFL